MSTRDLVVPAPVRWIVRAAFALFWAALALANGLWTVTAVGAIRGGLVPRGRDLALLQFWTVILVLMWAGTFFALTYFRLCEMRDLLAAHAASPARRPPAFAEPDHQSLN